MQDSSMSPATQTNGRWTREEHDKFILGSLCPDVGIQLYGKNWKKIEELIVTRTGAQIRSHAQKFFMKTQANDCAGVQGQENRPQPQPPQVREKQANKRGCPKQQKIPSICSPNFWYKMYVSLIMQSVVPFREPRFLLLEYDLTALFSKFCS